jgi:chemotaxis protein methyltransferase CheR
MFTVSIHETNRIIQILSEEYGIDLSAMAMASMRLKISQFCMEHHLHSVADIISCLGQEPGFIKLFLSGIYTSSPDIFRDPELWIMLREKILPDLARYDSRSGILFPDCVSGEEILSMVILLRESGMDKHFRLSTTSVHGNIVEQIRNRPLSKARYKLCQDNYSIFKPGSSLDRYFKLQEGKYYLKAGFPIPVETMKKESAKHDAVASQTKLVLYRNRMIYFNLETCQRRFNGMLDQVDIGTIIIIGIKESFKQLGLQHRLHVIYPDLNIHAKAR